MITIGNDVAGIDSEVLLADGTIIGEKKWIHVLASTTSATLEIKSQGSTKILHDGNQGHTKMTTTATTLMTALLLWTGSHWACLDDAGVSFS